MAAAVAAGVRVAHQIAHFGNDAVGGRAHPLLLRLTGRVPIRLLHRGRLRDRVASQGGLGAQAHFGHDSICLLLPTRI
jgi:hypothetical protein